MSEKLLLELYERIVTLENKVAKLEQATAQKLPDEKNKGKTISDVNGKYRYLADYLASSGEDIIDLTFTELEKIIRSKLPDSCRKHRAIWANSDSHSIAVAWIAAGYRTTTVDITGERVRFERRNYYEKQ